MVRNEELEIHQEVIPRVGTTLGRKGDSVTNTCSGPEARQSRLHREARTKVSKQGKGVQGDHVMESRLGESRAGVGLLSMRLQTPDSKTPRLQTPRLQTPRLQTPDSVARRDYITRRISLVDRSFVLNSR